jgi:hypothetical protein
MKGINMSNKEWFEIYHSDTTSEYEDVNVYTSNAQKSLLGDHDLVIIEEPSIRSNYSSMSPLMPHGNMILPEQPLTLANPEPVINVNITNNAGSCGCTKPIESFSTLDETGNWLESDKYGKYQKDEWELSTKLYIGSLSVIGLYVLFRSMQKSM